jgi:hypothetical protein
VFQLQLGIVTTSPEAIQLKLNNLQSNETLEAIQLKLDNLQSTKSLEAIRLKLNNLQSIRFKLLQGWKKTILI